MCSNPIALNPQIPIHVVLRMFPSGLSCGRQESSRIHLSQSRPKATVVEVVVVVVVVVLVTMVVVGARGGAGVGAAAAAVVVVVGTLV